MSLTMKPPKLVEGKNPINELDDRSLIMLLGFLVSEVLLFVGVFFWVRPLFIALILPMLTALWQLFASFVVVWKHIFGENSNRKQEKTLEGQSILWTMDMISSELLQGTKLIDMLESWFLLPDNFDSKNTIHVLQMLRYFEYLTAAGDLEKAKCIGEKLLELEDIRTLSREIKNGYQCEMIFLKIITGESKESVDKLCTEEINKYIYGSRYNIQGYRLRYAYAKFFTRDIKEMEEVKMKFVSESQDYFGVGDVPTEKMLMELVDSRELVEE